jgi:leucyl aminopeptidase (aminopeptidase T)
MTKVRCKFFYVITFTFIAGNAMEELIKAATIALRDCMAVRPEESVLVLCDDKTQVIGQALFEAGKSLAREVVLTVMPVRKVNGEEPPAELAELMSRYPVVVCPTQKSLTHTAARRNACKAGGRVGTMPGITEEMLVRTMRADYHTISERTKKVTAILDQTSLVKVSTELGTDILLPVEGIKAISSTGLLREKGAFGNLPSGESYLMPEEGKAEGIIIVDGAFAGIGKLADKPIRLVVKRGMVIDIEGGSEAGQLQEMLKPLAPRSYTIAELGIGTNDQARISGNILEDEKVMGTIHIALGNNISMGGSCDVGIHLDGIILQPTLWVDGALLLDRGKLLI